MSKDKKKDPIHERGQQKPKAPFGQQKPKPPKPQKGKTRGDSK